MSHPSPASANNVWSEYEVKATASLSDRASADTKHGDAFAVFDSSGDCGTYAETAEGLFFQDTRFLSRFWLSIEGQRPLLLTSAVHENKAALTVELTNPDIRLDDSQTPARHNLSQSHQILARQHQL